MDSSTVRGFCRRTLQAYQHLSAPEPIMVLTALRAVLHRSRWFLYERVDAYAHYYFHASFCKCRRTSGADAFLRRSERHPSSVSCADRYRQEERHMYDRFRLADEREGGKSTQTISSKLACSASGPLLMTHDGCVFGALPRAVWY